MAPLRFCVVMLDQADALLESRQRLASFAPLLERGLVDFGFWQHDTADVVSKDGQHPPSSSSSTSDAAAAEPQVRIQLLHSQQVLVPGSVRNPLTVTANYVLDSLAHDIFYLPERTCPLRRACVSSWRATTGRLNHESLKLNLAFQLDEGPSAITASRKVAASGGEDGGGRDSGRGGSSGCSSYGDIEDPLILRAIVERATGRCGGVAAAAAPSAPDTYREAAGPLGSVRGPTCMVPVGGAQAMVDMASLCAEDAPLMLFVADKFFTSRAPGIFRASPNEHRAAVPGTAAAGSNGPAVATAGPCGLVPPHLDHHGDDASLCASVGVHAEALAASLEIILGGQQILPARQPCRSPGADTFTVGVFTVPSAAARHRTIVDEEQDRARVATIASGGWRLALRAQRSLDRFSASDWEMVWGFMCESRELLQSLSAARIVDLLTLSRLDYELLESIMWNIVPVLRVCTEVSIDGSTDSGDGGEGGIEAKEVETKIMEEDGSAQDGGVQLIRAARECYQRRFALTDWSWEMQRLEFARWLYVVGEYAASLETLNDDSSSTSSSSTPRPPVGAAARHVVCLSGQRNLLRTRCLSRLGDTVQLAAVVKRLQQHPEACQSVRGEGATVCKACTRVAGLAV